MKQSLRALCMHQELDVDLHEFKFQEGSREAVSDWAAHIEALQLDHKWYNRKQIRLLMDATQAPDLPIRYIFEMLSDYNRAYPDLEPPAIRIAYLHPADAKILSIYYQFAELMRQPTAIEFFAHRSEAEQWLLGS